MLFNGKGNITRYNNQIPNTLPVPERYTLHFDAMDQLPALGRAKRYLLRLINTSFDSTFVFSIDNHILTIVGTDFVPIHNYTNTSVLVGIGQRYHVIVEAKPISLGRENPLPPSGNDNYWIRTWRADCFGNTTASDHYEEAGILRYGNSEALPNSQKWPGIATACSDETYTSLHPILEWQVGRPANDPAGLVGENFTVQFQNAQTIFPLSKFSMGGETYNPLHIDYGNPTFLNLNNTDPWNPGWVVFSEPYTSGDWVSLTQTVTHVLLTTMLTCICPIFMLIAL